MRSFNTFLIASALIASALVNPDDSPYSTQENLENCAAHPWYRLLRKINIKDVCPPTEHLQNDAVVLPLLGVLIPYISIYGSVAFALTIPFTKLLRFIQSKFDWRNTVTILALFAALGTECALVNKVEKWLAVTFFAEEAHRPLGAPSTNPIGMPSGHSTSSGALLYLATYLLAHYAVVSRKSPSTYARLRTIFFGACACLCAAVAVSRVAARYHTIAQIVIGLTIGLFRGRAFIKHHRTSFLQGSEGALDNRAFDAPILDWRSPVGWARVWGLIVLGNAVLGSTVHWGIAIIAFLWWPVVPLVQKFSGAQSAHTKSE